MKERFYIDESGNTGDLIVTEDNDDFSSQKYFSLACVGFNDSVLNEFESNIYSIKSKYKIQAPQLKFSKIKGVFGKKIGFILEILKAIEDKSKILIEVVDKRYYISTVIVNCLINPPYFREDVALESIKNIHLELSQWVYENVTKEFLINFTNISRNPSEEGLNILFDDLKGLAKEKGNSQSRKVLSKIEEAINCFEEFKNYKELKREAYTYFLPLPDLNKRGELISILPYISSFTNLHARLNHLYGEDLSEITIIHDNQSHFDEMLKYYHQDAANYTDGESEVFEYADFNFSNISSLEFQDDKDSIGLQISDIFAGFINKSVSCILFEENKLSEPENNVLLRVMAALYFTRSINFVLPMKQNEKIFEILDVEVERILNLARSGANIDEEDDLLLDKVRALNF